MSWQPIETAPKDGSEIIVMYIHCDTQIVHAAFYANPKDGWPEEDEGWWSYTRSEVAREMLDGFMSPAHWMLLPEQPK